MRGCEIGAVEMRRVGARWVGWSRGEGGCSALPGTVRSAPIEIVARAAPHRLTLFYVSLLGVASARGMQVRTSARACDVTAESERRALGVPSRSGAWGVHSRGWRARVYTFACVHDRSPSRGGRSSTESVTRRTHKRQECPITPHVCKFSFVRRSRRENYGVIAAHQEAYMAAVKSLRAIEEADMQRQDHEDSYW